MKPHDELRQLTSVFENGADLIEQAEHIPSSSTPEPYRSLLVHNQHMTVTMERFYGTSVAVEVLDRCWRDGLYYRKILLRRSDTQRVVQFGLVRFDFSYVSDEVRNEILSEHIPLGRVLIDHQVLRDIDLGAVLRIAPGPELQRLLGEASNQPLYGRLATIFCNGKPAVDLLEIAAPAAG